MALSIIGWVDGITASCVVLIGCIFGIYFIYKSKKLEANILFNVGLVMTFAGLALLGVFLDFVVVLSTGKNIANNWGQVGLLSYVWVAPLIVIGILIGAELMIPEKKWHIVSVFLVLMIVFEILLFLNPRDSFNFVEPSPSGSSLIDYNLKLTTPAGILMIIFIASVVLFLGVGFLIKAIQSTGDLRRKFLLLMVGILMYAIFGLLESLMEPGFLLIPIRIGYISGPFFMYLGLKD